MSMENVIKALQASWSPETCFEVSEWSIENPARGQCVSSSLVVQKLLGGELRRYRVKGRDFEETHYCNILPDETILDTTGAQYTEPVTLIEEPVDLKGFKSIREKRLADNDTREKYEKLLQRVETNLRLN